MAKTATIKKVVNGEIADADDVNQIVENAGNEGGAIPYDDADQTRAGNGQESIGSAAYPWGGLYINRDANFVEVDPDTNTEASSVTFSAMRNFIKQKDTPDSFSGQGGKRLAVNSAENALEFKDASTIEIFTSDGPFTSPAGVTKVYVTMVGAGGGGGGGGGASNGGGGGGGAGVVMMPITVSPSTEYTLQIGVGGAGGSNAPAPGSAGESTIFDTGGDAVTVAGGSGGAQGDGGAGGAAGSTGSTGEGGGVLRVEDGVAGSTRSHGGPTVLGPGGEVGDGSGPKTAPANVGGGGGGGDGGGANDAHRYGGQGSDGVIIITY